MGKDITDQAIANIQDEAERTVLTLKDEQFARYIVEDRYSLKDAYIKAYNPGSTNPGTLQTNAKVKASIPQIKRRIGELQMQQVLRVGITADAAIVEAWESAKEARQKRQYMAQSRLLELVFKALGMLVEKHEITTKLSVDELAMVVGQREDAVEGEYREIMDDAEERSDWTDEEKAPTADQDENDIDWYRRNHGTVKPSEDELSNLPMLPPANDHHD